MAIATPPSTLTPDEHPWRTEVDSSPTPVTVTAMLVVQDPDDPRLPETYAALAAQQQRPQRLVLVDATPDRSVRASVEDGTADLAGADAPWRQAYPELSVVVVPPGAPFAEIVDTAVDALPGPGEDLVVTRRSRERARKRTVRARDKREWLWLLHEDSAPGPGALRGLMQEAARSERVGIAGCKVVEAQRPDRLINVGLDLTRTGRHVGAHVEGEPDQGQHDERRDVLSVSSAGMLVRRDVYLTLGGFDPAFDGDGDGLDVCWRTHLLGFQVVVIPTARVQQQLPGGDPDDGEAPGGRRDVDRPRPRSGRTLRRHRQVALARCSLLGLPFAALWVALSGAFMAVLMLLLKRPRRALAEAAQATAPLGITRIIGARHRFRGRGATRRRHLDALFVPTRTALRDALDAVRGALTPEPDLDDPQRGLVSSTRRSLTLRVVTHPGLWLTIVLTAITVLRWRPLLGSGTLRGSASGLTGGDLLPFATDAEGIWRLWRDDWGGPGLGQLSPEQPFLPVLAALARVAELLPWVEDSTSGATVVGWLLIGSAPLSGIAAYLAGRAATRAAWPRAAAGLIWAGLATLSTASAQGRLGPVVVHLLLPLVLAGALTVARRRAGAPSTFGAVLAAAVMGAFAPAALAFTTVLALGVVALGRGWGRARAAVVAVVPWALLGPWTVVRLVEEPRALLAGPGALSTLAPVEPWQLALAHPGGPGSFISWWSAPFLALGVLAIGFPARGRARALIGLSVLALLGLAGGLAASSVTVSATDGAERSPWAGVPLDVMAASLLALALVVFGPRLRGGQRPRAGAWRVGSVAALTVTIAAAGVVAGITAWEHPVESLTAAEARTPGVAEHMAHGTRATRMLTLQARPDGSVTYQLDGREQGAPARDLDVPAQTDPLLERSVRAVLTGSRDDAVPSRLTELAIGFIGVTGSGDRTAITRSLAGMEGLSPMASGNASSLWRVQPPSRSESVPVSRLRITSGGQLLSAVPTDDPNARTEQSIPAGPEGRILQVAQAPGWGRDADVTLGGAPLERVAGPVPSYALPTGGGQLQTAPALSFPAWRWAQGLALAGCIFLAIPFGNARSRGRA